MKPFNLSLTGKLLLVFPAVLFWFCNGPELVFPEAPKAVAKLSGFIYPSGKGGTAYLLEYTVIDSAEIDSNSGFFVFRNVSYGYYQLKIVVDGFAVFRKVVSVNNSGSNLGVITLSRLPMPVIKVDIEDSIPIVFGTCRSKYRNYYPVSQSDTAVNLSIHFDAPMDSLSTIGALTIEPRMQYHMDLMNRITSGMLTISISVLELFRYSEMTITLGRSAKTVYGDEMDFDLKLHYSITSECYQEVLFSQFIQKTTPANKDVFVETSTEIL